MLWQVPYNIYQKDRMMHWVSEVKQQSGCLCVYLFMGPDQCYHLPTCPRCCAVCCHKKQKKKKNRQRRWTNAHWSKHSRPLALRTPVPPLHAPAWGFVSGAAAQTSAMKVEPDLTGHETSQSKKHYSTSGSAAEYISHPQWHSALIMETGQQNKCHLVSDRLTSLF